MMQEDRDLFARVRDLLERVSGCWTPDPDCGTGDRPDHPGDCVTHPELVRMLGEVNDAIVKGRRLTRAKR